MDRWTRNIIADLYNSAEVWVSYGEYTISESHLESGILHWRYESDIPMINRFSRIVVRWRYLHFRKCLSITDIHLIHTLETLSQTTVY
jgi:hypothetical protein